MLTWLAALRSRTRQSTSKQPPSVPFLISQLCSCRPVAQQRVLGGACTHALYTRFTYTLFTHFTHTLSTRALFTHASHTRFLHTLSTLPHTHAFHKLHIHAFCTRLHTLALPKSENHCLSLLLSLSRKSRKSRLPSRRVRDEFLAVLFANIHCCRCCSWLSLLIIADHY